MCGRAGPADLVFRPLRKKHLPATAGTLKGSGESGSRRVEGIWKLGSASTAGATLIGTAKKNVPFSLPF